MTLGFHTGIKSKSRGLEDDFLKPLNGAGIPTCVKFADDALGAALMAKRYEHARVILRFTRPKGASNDLPDYSLGPEEAAKKHWARIKWQLEQNENWDNQEISGLSEVKDRLWIETCNEPDKNRADWLGGYAYYFSLLANKEGWKVIPFSMNSGEPEPEQWREPQMQQFLTLAGKRPDRIAVGLHEAKITDRGWTDEDGNELTIDSHPKHWHNWLIGRYEWLFEECDAMQISRPTTFLTEWAFDYRNLPAREIFLRDAEWLYREVSKWEEVRGLCFWNLQDDSKWGDLASKLQAMISPLGKLMLEIADTEEPEEPEEEDERSLFVALWEEANKRGPSNEDAALQKSLKRQGYSPYSPEFWYDYNGDKYAVQLGVDWDTMERVVAFTKVPDWGNVQMIKAGDVEETPTAKAFYSPVGTPEERAQGNIWPGAWQDANPFGNRYKLHGSEAFHTGADLNLNQPYFDADNNAPVFSMGAGKVTFAGYIEVWGNVVVIEHVTPEGDIAHSRYAHLSRINVGKGQIVEHTDLLGIIGGEEVGYPNHLHFDISMSNVLASDPGYWPGLNWDALQRHFVNPQTFLTKWTSALDMADYFLPSNGKTYGTSVRLTNNWGEGDEWQQVQREGDISYVVKNAQWEARRISPNYIYLLADTSPGNGQYYTVEGIWVPRFWKPGDTFERTERVSFHRKDDCQPVAGKAYESTSLIKFSAHHESFTTPSGLRLNDVVEVHWIVAGRVEEMYFYARSKGLVMWKARDGRQSYAVEIDDTRSKLGRETIPCLDF